MLAQVMPADAMHWASVQLTAAGQWDRAVTGPHLVDVSRPPLAQAAPLVAPLVPPVAPAAGGPPPGVFGVGKMFL
jgi:hypothetical protein